MGRRAPLAERMAAMTVPEPNTGCWLWMGAVMKTGYGKTCYGRDTHDGPARNVLAHRAAWELQHGPIPPGMHVCHKCDMRCCVNPDHLFLGTNADNHADKVRKGRQSRGPRHRAAIAGGWAKRRVRQAVG